MTTKASRPQLRAEILAIDSYVPGKSPGKSAVRTFKLSANESPLGPSPKAVQAFADVAGTLALYPDGSSLSLREAIGETYTLNPAQILCGNGSGEIIDLLARVFLREGDEAIYSQYEFLSYPIVIRAAGAHPIVAPEQDLCANIDAICARVTERTKIVFLANPNNPTGTLVSRGLLQRLLEKLPPHILLVLDAAYAEYVHEEDYDPGIALVNAHENVVMLRTFSKAYGLAGARLGWIYAQPYVIEALNRIRGPFNINMAAQAAGVAALRDQEHLAAALAHNQRWRPWLRQALLDMGLDVPASHANFLLIRFADAPTAQRIERALSAAGYVLRGLSSYGLPACLRLSIGVEEANLGVITTLRQCL